MGFFTQRIDGDGAPRVVDGALPVARARQRVEQLPQRRKILLREPAALLEDPFVVLSRQEFSTVEVDGAGEPFHGRWFPEGGRERDDIGGDEGGIEADGEVIGDEDGMRRPLRRRQLAAQEMKRLPQAVAPILRRRIRPEEVHQVIAKVSRTVQRIRQVSEEPGRLAAAKARDDLPPRSGR